jgi:hypothetical protein
MKATIPTKIVGFTFSDLFTINTGSAEISNVISDWNIVFITSDEHNPKIMGCAGSKKNANT